MKISICFKDFPSGIAVIFHTQCICPYRILREIDMNVYVIPQNSVLLVYLFWVQTCQIRLPDINLDTKITFD